MTQVESEKYKGITFYENEILKDHFETISNNKSGIMKEAKPIHPKDVRVNQFTSLTQKLIDEIDIQQEDLWICEVKNSRTVRVFFSGSGCIPKSDCCHHPIYVEYFWDLSGNLACSKCLSKIFSFVMSGDQKDRDMESSKLFKRKQKQSNRVKTQIMKTFSTRQFLHRNLKENLINKYEQTLKQSNGFVIEGHYNYVERPQTASVVKKSEKMPPNLQELKEIIQQIFH